MDTFEEATLFALQAHQGMIRKRAGIPYILHPCEVATIVSTMTTDREVLAAAVLHDVVEDTPVSLEQIEERFGARVAKLVACESENKHPEMPKDQSWRLRKEESLADLAAGGRDEHMIWLGDKLSNMRSFYQMLREEGNGFWQHFNQRDSAQQAWYYDTVAQMTSDLSEELAWQEYRRLVDVVFEEELS